MADGNGSKDTVLNVLLIAAIAIILLMIAFSACGCITETHRGLNDQNAQAGALIVEKATEPDVKQAGADVAANAQTLARDCLGAPKVSAAYSPAKSAELRQTSTDEAAIKKTWLDAIYAGALGLLSAFGIPGAIAGALGAAAGALAIYRKYKPLIDVLIKGGSEVIKALPASKGTIIDTLTTVQTEAGLKDAVAKLVDKAKA